MEVRTGYADVEDAQLYYEEAGRGTPLVLLHSAVADSNMWDEQFESFAREHRVIRYDLRGYGRSIQDPGPFSHRSDLHILLNLLNVQQSFLMGCGVGAHIIIDFALLRPRAIAGMILVSPAVQEKRRNGSHMMNGNGSSEELMPIDPAIARRLGQIRIPTIVITGERDTSEVANTARLLYTSIPDAIKANLPGAGHLPNVERPTQFNRIVLTFLDWVKSRQETIATPNW